MHDTKVESDWEEMPPLLDVQSLSLIPESATMNQKSRCKTEKAHQMHESSSGNKGE